MPRLHIRRVPLDKGGYDSSGSYWGVGQKLYRFESEDGQVHGHIRAPDYAEAKARVQKFLARTIPAPSLLTED